MTLRLLLAGFALLAAAGTVRADETYKLPEIGAQLTFRMMTTVKLAEQTIITGQVYTYTITAANGPTFEATIKPRALIYGCSEGDTRKDCLVAAKMPDAKREGDLVTVPVPDDIAEKLSKESAYKGRYFAVEERKYPVPGPSNPDDVADAKFGDTPLFVLTNRQDCDYGPFDSFFPLGKTPRLTLSCHNIFSRTHSRIGTDQTLDEPISVELSYIGPDKVTLPSGAWDVQKIALKFISGDVSHAAVQSESDVATKLGVAVKAHSVINNPSAHLTSDSTSELIAFKP